MVEIVQAKSDSVMAPLSTTTPLAQRMLDCKTKADKEQFKYDICEYIGPSTAVDPHSKMPDYLWKRKSDFKPHRKHLTHEISRRESGHRPAQWPVSKMIKFLLETPGGREIEAGGEVSQTSTPVDDDVPAETPAPAPASSRRDVTTSPAITRREVRNKPASPAVKLHAGDLQRLCDEEKLRRLKRENDLAQEEETNRLIEHYELALGGIEKATNSTVKAMRSKQAASLKRKIDKLLGPDEEDAASGGDNGERDGP